LALGLIEAELTPGHGEPQSAAPGSNLA